MISGKMVIICYRVSRTLDFIKENGKFLNEKVDKKVWLIWMEGRVHEEYDAIKTPIGFIPKYEDLKDLFKAVFNRNYTKDDYNKQFAIRLTKWIEKMDRIKKIYDDEEDIPKEFLDVLADQTAKLKEAKEKYNGNK